MALRSTAFEERPVGLEVGSIEQSAWRKAFFWVLPYALCALRYAERRRNRQPTRGCPTESSIFVGQGFIPCRKKTTATHKGLPYVLRCAATHKGLPYGTMDICRARVYPLPEQVR